MTLMDVRGARRRFHEKPADRTAPPPGWLLVSANWLVCCLIGCTAPIVRSQTPEEPAVSESSPDKRLVGDFARPWGLRYLEVEGIALVTQLRGTGSDPPPSAQRAAVLEDMKRREVEYPQRLLASPNTSVVLVRAYLPPGAQKGDRVDVEVRTPSRSETTSLRGGWLMQSRLQEMAILGNQLRTGHVLAVAEGHVLVDADLEEDRSDPQPGREDVLLTRGRVLGGGMATRSRPLGLVLRSEHHGVRTSALLGAAINRRFHTFDRGVKRGAATPKRDNFVELQVHPRYRNNLLRYVRVVLAIPVRETASEQLVRLGELEQKLLAPGTAAVAAIELEAIGPEAVRVLDRGLESPDPEVRFYAAEALGYLNEESAVPHLLAAARDESAFRWHALTALSTMDSLRAHDALSELLHVDSAETRYGAFQALEEMNPRDPQIKGEILRDQFILHQLPSTGQPMIHVRRSRRPEIVVFGADQQLVTPFAVSVGHDLMIKSLDSGTIRVARYTVGQQDRDETCSSRVVDLIRTMVQIDASYCDVVAALAALKRQNALPGRLAFDALPTPGRTYHRTVEDDGSAEPSDATLPDLFDDQLPEGHRSADTEAL